MSSIIEIASVLEREIYVYLQITFLNDYVLGKMTEDINKIRRYPALRISPSSVEVKTTESDSCRTRIIKIFRAMDGIITGKR